MILIYTYAMGVGKRLTTMAGKYEKFRKLYPKAPIEATQFERINIVLDAPAFPQDPSNKLRVRDLNNSQLAELYKQVRKQMDELDARLSVLETQKAALTHVFVQRFEEDDVTSMKFADGVTLSENVEPLPNVKNREELYKWIKQEKLIDLLTINYQTLASLVKQLLLEGKPIPPGVEVYMKQKLSAKGLKNTEETNNE
jgi:hypothetical protein